MQVEQNRAAAEGEDIASWREELSLRLTRAFCLVFALSVVVLWITVRGDFARWFMTGLALTATALLAVPALTGCPTGKLRAWLLVVPVTAATLTSFALVGFLSAAGVLLTTSLMLAGLLLGRRVMLWLAVASALVIGGIAWGMVNSVLQLPDPQDVSMRSAFAWARTMSISFFAIGLFGTMMLAVIRRMESSLLLARSETLRREQAERERAEAQIGVLEAKQLETIGRLAAGVAHDFNNNLTAIMGCAELLKLELPPRSSGQSLANDILQSSQRAADLTRQLLAYSRKAQMLLAPTDVHRLIESAVSLLRRSVDPGVLITTGLLASRAIVQADPSLLQNAILNLLVNARDAMPKGGKLDIITSSHELQSDSEGLGRGLPHGHYLLLEVRDTGSGISEEALPKIFDPFFTTKPLGKGTGLGLAAVAGTAKALGGAISAETELGQGSVFRLLLPVERAEPELKSEEPARPTRGAGEILVVDDEALVRGTVAATLRSLGYGVTEVADGVAAIELVQADIARFDLVLLDLRMPKLSGEATFDALMKINSRLRVLIWSGHGAEQDLEEILRRGAVGFVQKPYRIADLSRVVAEAIAKPAR